MSRIIDPSPEHECCCCRAANVRLNLFKSGIFEKEKEHQHCDLCFETFAGNTCDYPVAYDRETAQIMQHINHVANLVIRELKRR